MEPSEFDHVAELLKYNENHLPECRDILLGLIDTLIEDARSDLAAQDAWYLSDPDLIRALINETRPPGKGEVFPRAALNSLENKAALWLISLLASRRMLLSGGSVRVDADAVISTGRELLLERQNAIVLAMEPHAAMGEKHSREQSQRGKKGAKKRWSDTEARNTVSEILTNLAAHTDELGDPLPPAEIWPELYSEMERENMAPREEGAANLKASRYVYADQQVITYDAFRQRILRIRRAT